MAMEPGTRATDEEYVDYSSDKYCEESDHGSPPCFVDGTHTMKLGISGRGPAIFEEPHTSAWTSSFLVVLPWHGEGFTAPVVSKSLYVRYTVLVDTSRFLAMSL